MNTLDSFRIVWGDSLAELVGREPANLEGELAPVLDGLEVSASRAEVGRIVAALTNWLWSRNQFLQLSAGDREELTQSVELALRTMKRRDQARAALRTHRKELKAIVLRKLGEEPLEVTCAEYTPQLQLQVLGLPSLAGPILDVGCGPSAALVQHLRAQGLEAKGLDRALDPALGINADWLEHDYGQANYRSVLSHQGFSLHFLHHHHAQGDTALAYARTYMSILRSLLPGGVFAYAPGLPFIEPMLQGNAYQVRRVPFADALRVPALVEVEQRTGLSFSYATHVERI